ncbi:unnamed protein product [Pleuronectes platessa]|uniref:Uncharacterized protein n=1 Tax=Pleuronectes platessa TaxID=8262 RepID=A0A9N7VCJ4_PLEPL|nr:unnamed protein product [Pleuronectes platessa]
MSPSTTDESKQTPVFPETEEGSSGDQTTEVFTVKPSGIEKIPFGEETETFVSVTPTSDEQVSSQEAKITLDTPYTSQATEPPASSYTTMSPHTIGVLVSDHTTVDSPTVRSSSEQEQDGPTAVSSPIPSIMYQNITDQQVVIITPSSSQPQTDFTEQTPTMVLHVSKPSTSTTIIFTEDITNEDELLSTVTDSMKEGTPTPELITEDTIIDVDTIFIVPSSSAYPTIQTEEAGVDFKANIYGTCFCYGDIAQRDTHIITTCYPSYRCVHKL